VARARDGALGEVHGHLRRLARVHRPQGRAPRRRHDRADRARAPLAGGVPVAAALALPAPEERRVTPAAATRMLGTVAALCAVSFAAYALMGGAPDRDAEKKGAQFVLGGGNFFVHWLLWVLTPLTWLALRLGLTPDFFNLAGLLSGALAGLLIG